MLSYGNYAQNNKRFIPHSFKSIRLRKVSINLESLCVMIGISFMLNISFMIYSNQHSSSGLKQLEIHEKSEDSNNDIISTIERSRKALEKLKMLLSSVASPNDRPWIWKPTKRYPSVPYQPSSHLNQSSLKISYNITDLPQSVTNEVNRVCQRLKEANNASGEIWCKLFNNTYTDTLLRATSIVDDKSTYIITGDIDLMWLRDSR